MESIKFSTQLVNGILQYLGTRPYGEVFQIIEAVQKEAREQQANNPSQNDGEQIV